MRPKLAALLALPLLVPLLLVWTGAAAAPVGRTNDDAPAAYTREVRYDPGDGFLLFGDEKQLRASAPMMSSSLYAEVVRSMPIICVDVVLRRESDGAVLLVKRHAEPVRGFYWWPGGRLMMGESFSEAAVRKVRKEIGIEASTCAQPLFTYNTIFEASAWNHPTQTINVLMHAVTRDVRADRGLRICVRNRHSGEGLATADLCRC
jgi:ADP-ribose pyrophosphatase YjhB (NUDIX family)